MVRKIRPEVIGEIGESVAAEHLISLGYELAQFGKSMSDKSSKRRTLPVVPDFGAGYSYGVFGVECYAYQHGVWTDSKVPRWCDVALQKIQVCAIKCRTESDCSMRDRSPGIVPCANIQNFLSKEWLCSISPDCNGLSVVVDGVKIKAKGNVVIGECLRRIRPMLREEYKRRFVKEQDFVLFNQLVSEYVQQCWIQWSKANPLPHSGKTITDLMEKPGSHQLVERMKDENLAAMRAIPDGHPGRFDWFGFDGGQLTAIEVKTNSSELNHWQVIRFGLLQKFGYRTMLVKVRLSMDSIEKGMKGESVSAESIELIEKPELPKSVPIPSLEEFTSMLTMQFSHDDRYPIFY